MEASQEGLILPRIPEKVLRAGLAYRGELWWLLKPSQLALYRWIKEWKSDHPQEAGPLIANCHRGFGKTFTQLVLAFERCLSRPGQIVRFGAPSLEQCEDYCVPAINYIQARMPVDLKPRKRDTTWTFVNPYWESSAEPSTFHLIGCRERANRHRGKRSDFVILDEVADFEDLEYVAQDVFGGHFVTRNDPLLMMITTPPRNPAHPFIRTYVPEAIAEGRYECIPTTDNSDWREQDDLMLSKICRGKHTVAWRREAKCELVADTSDLIIPEYRDHRDEVIVEAYDRPKWFFPRVSADVGLKDFTAILFGYLDWERQILVIEHEWVERYLTDKQIVDGCRQIEEKLWGGDEPAVNYHAIRRFADATGHTLHSIHNDYNFRFVAAEKYDREAAIINLRAKFDFGRVKIHSSCKNLDAQLMNGVWDKNRRDFIRDPEHGHFDAGMALVYLNRMIEWRLNPIPRQHRSMHHMHQGGAKFVPERGSALVSRGAGVVTRNGSIEHGAARVIRSRRRFR